MDLEKGPKTPERLTGNRKFVMTSDGKIYFAQDEETLHPQIVQRLIKEGVIPDDSVIRGGGLADCDNRYLHGLSKDYGSFDRKEAKKILPDWIVIEPDEK